MNNLLGPGLVSGNEIITLRNGDEIFPAMLKAIRGAKPMWLVGVNWAMLAERTPGMASTASSSPL